MSCSSPMLPAAKLASSVPSSARMVVHGGVLDLQVCRGALQQGRLQEAGGGEGIHCQIGGGIHAGSVLQGGDPAVDGRHRAAEGVESRHQGVAGVALGEGRPEEQAADEVGRELVLDEVEEAVALGHRGVPSKVPGAKLLLLRYRPSASAFV